MAYHYDWFRSLPEATGHRWLKIATYAVFAWAPIVILGGALDGDPAMFSGGPHWQSLAISLWEATVGTGLILGLLVLFRSRYDRQGPLLEKMAANAYTVYIIHAPVLVGLSCLVRDLHIYPLLKFALVTATCIPLCFALSRLPGTAHSRREQGLINAGSPRQPGVTVALPAAPAGWPVLDNP